VRAVLCAHRRQVREEEEEEGSGTLVQHDCILVLSNLLKNASNQTFFRPQPPDSHLRRFLLTADSHLRPIRERVCESGLYL
jgi:hypothetical protein